MKWGENRRYFHKFDHGFINITMTHRTDSNIFYPYTDNVPFAKIFSEGKLWVDRHLEKKKNVAVSFNVVISNLLSFFSSVFLRTQRISTKLHNMNQ